jgi:hypothetical protein
LSKQEVKHHKNSWIISDFMSMEVMSNGRATARVDWLSQYSQAKLSDRNSSQQWYVGRTRGECNCQHAKSKEKPRKEKVVSLPIPGNFTIAGESREVTQMIASANAIVNRYRRKEGENTV